MAALTKAKRPEVVRPFGFEDLDDWFAGFSPEKMPAPQMNFPRIETSVRAGHFVVKADLPGIRSQDVQVSVEANHLTIKGERKMSKEVRRKNFHRSELFYGSFERSIPLPGGVRTEKLKARYHGGVLEITAPYDPARLPQKIDVQIEKTA
jgi:HSP20 family protein